MVSNGVPNGATNGGDQSKFDPNFTNAVVDAMGSNVSPRTRKIFASLVKHIHDFTRENEITVDEYTMAIDFVNAAGKMSDDRRNENRMVLAVLGMEALLDEIAFKAALDAPEKATASSILGPFHRKDAPRYKMGDSIIQNNATDGVVFMHGRVTDALTGEPVENAELDIWQAARNGEYEQLDPNQPEMNLRGRFTTGPDGRYSLYALQPTPYRLPPGVTDTILELLDRPPWRPAHIHFIVTKKSYKPLVTQIYDSSCKYLKKDVACAVHDGLIVDFVLRENDPKAKLEVNFDFKIVKDDAIKQGAITGATQDSPPLQA